MITIDLMSRKPIYDQLVENIGRLILAGAFQPGAQLPSVRSLSCKLSVNPNTIQKAYSRLCDTGVAYSVAGKGCFVSPGAVAVLNQRAKDTLPEFRQVVHSLLDSGISSTELIAIIRQESQERSDS